MTTSQETVSPVPPSGADSLELEEAPFQISLQPGKFPPPEVKLSTTLKGRPDLLPHLEGPLRLPLTPSLSLSATTNAVQSQVVKTPLSSHPTRDSKVFRETEKEKETMKQEKIVEKTAETSLPLTSIEQLTTLPRSQVQEQQEGNVNTKTEQPKILSQADADVTHKVSKQEPGPNTVHPSGRLSNKLPSLPPSPKRALQTAHTKSKEREISQKDRMRVARSASLGILSKVSAAPLHVDKEKDKQEQTSPSPSPFRLSLSKALPKSSSSIALPVSSGTSTLTPQAQGGKGGTRRASLSSSSFSFSSSLRSPTHRGRQREGGEKKEKRREKKKTPKSPRRHQNKHRSLSASPSKGPGKNKVKGGPGPVSRSTSPNRKKDKDLSHRRYSSPPPLTARSSKNRTGSLTQRPPQMTTTTAVHAIGSSHAGSNSNSSGASRRNSSPTRAEALQRAGMWMNERLKWHSHTHTQLDKNTSKTSKDVSFTAGRDSEDYSDLLDRLSSLCSGRDRLTSAHSTHLDALEAFSMDIANREPPLGEKNRKGTNGASTYGELSREACRRIFSLFSKDLLNQDCAFVDIGSGSGKVVINCAARTDVRVSVGLELSEQRHRLAVAALKAASQMWPEGELESRVRLGRGNLLDVDLEDLVPSSSSFSSSSSGEGGKGGEEEGREEVEEKEEGGEEEEGPKRLVVFVASLCFHSVLLERLLEVLERDERVQLVVATNRLPLQNLKRTDMEFLPTSWSAHQPIYFLHRASCECSTCAREQSKAAGAARQLELQQAEREKEKEKEREAAGRRNSNSKGGRAASPARKTTPKRWSM